MKEHSLREKITIYYESLILAKKKKKETLKEKKH